MATKNQKGVPENLRKQLALAVRNIQWNYAILWSISPIKPGVLEWCDGYYNGDIKTRKMVQAVDLNADQLGLQRTDQLRELFHSLELGEMNPQAKRPTAALSPEDLTDAEWYFLVCMSFVFNIDQGLPGRTLAKKRTSWLCNAHRADTKVFSRSLLAKSASIQTIVCFPHLEGVIELGATDLVPEDLNLIRHIKASFLNCSAIVPEILSPITNNNEPVFEVAGFVNVPKNGFDQLLDGQDLDIYSPNDISDDLFSDCISQTYRNPEIVVPVLENNGTENYMNDNQECHQQKQINSGIQDDDIHYQIVLSNLLKTSQQLILGPYFRNGSRESSFVNWRKEGLLGCNVRQTGTPQKLLKKVLFEVAKMHENSRVQSGQQNVKKDEFSRPAVDENERNHVLSERKRREKMNERFMILGSFGPSGGKVDKISILDHTIEYLRELKEKVEELQSHKKVTKIVSSTQTKSHDAIVRTYDNYPTRMINSKKPLTNKRKSCDVDNTGVENSMVRLRDDICVNIIDKDVSIAIYCSWKESLFLDVMEVIRKLNLNTETVESSNTDGMLSIIIKSKCKGLKVASANVIRQALQKAIMKT